MRVDRSQITPEWIANRILIEWSAADLKYLKSGQQNFGVFARAVRNDYGLWEFDHPLTQHWHMYPEARNIVDGIDCSEDHPDAVSAVVLDLVKARL